MMLVDSHCHLDFPELSEQLPQLLSAMRMQDVEWVLCPGVTLERLPAVFAIAEANPHIYAAVGVHPDTQEGKDPDADELVALAAHPKVVAIGETGLDYYRLEGDLEWQRTRFRNHIRAAHRVSKPLIIHTRSASADTLSVMRDEQAERAGGVFHCFTEDIEVARQALDMGFYISFSGIITFKNAEALREIVRWVPLDRILVETDAPYLAPVPYRGKLNQPAYVRHVAEEVSRQRGMSLESIAEITSNNFFKLFFPNGIQE